jgi:hypothetical protein
MQTGGQLECSIPIGIPTKNQIRYQCYKSTIYQTDSNYPGPPNEASTKPALCGLCCIRGLAFDRCGSGGAAIRLAREEARQAGTKLNTA